MKKRILLVDDEVMITEVMATLIQKGHPDWEIVVEATLQSAVARVDEVFDGLITDFNLGDGRGTVLISLVRRQKLPWKVILMSGLDAELARVEGEKVGINYFLAKPFKPELLEEALHTVGLTD